MAAGGEPARTLPNGVVGEYAYDAASRLTSITYKQNGTTVLGDLTYEYDKNGHRTRAGGSYARTRHSASNQLNSLQRGQSSDDLRRQDPDLRQQRQSSNDYRLQRDDDVHLERAEPARRHQRAGSKRDFCLRRFGREERKKTINGSLTEFLYDGVDPVQETSGATILANMLSGAGSR